MCHSPLVNYCASSSLLVTDQASIPMCVVSTDSLDQQDQNAGAEHYLVVWNQTSQGYNLTGGRVSQQSDRGCDYTLCVCTKWRYMLPGILKMMPAHCFLLTQEIKWSSETITPQIKVSVMLRWKPLHSFSQTNLTVTNRFIIDIAPSIYSPVHQVIKLIITHNNEMIINSYIQVNHYILSLQFLVGAFQLLLFHFLHNTLLIETAVYMVNTSEDRSANFITWKPSYSTPVTILPLPT